MPSKVCNSPAVSRFAALADDFSQAENVSRSEATKYRQAGIDLEMK